MKSRVIEVVAEDAVTLLERVFIGKHITAFGEDGFGRYGRSSLPHTFEAHTIHVEAVDLDPGIISAIGIQLTVELDGYSASDFGGSMATDQNAMISIQKLLAAHHIDRSAFTWADISLQGENSIVLQTTAQKLDIL